MSIESILEDAPALLRDWRPEHTPIQLEHFVIENNSAGTLWGRYVQSMRELSGRVEGLRAAETATRMLMLDVVAAQIDFDEAFDQLPYADPGSEKEEAGAELELKTRRQSLRVDRACLALDQAKAAVVADAVRRASAAREAETVFQLARNAHAEIGELTEERRTELEWQYWRARFVQKMVMARLAGAPISDEIVVSIAHFPKVHRKALAEVFLSPMQVLEKTHAIRLGLAEPPDGEGTVRAI